MTPNSGVILLNLHVSAVFGTALWLNVLTGSSRP